MPTAEGFRCKAAFQPGRSTSQLLNLATKIRPAVRPLHPANSAGQPTERSTPTDVKFSPLPQDDVGQSTYVAMVALISANSSPGRRPHDAVNGTMIISGASE